MGLGDITDVTRQEKKDDHQVAVIVDAGICDCERGPFRRGTHKLLETFGGPITCMNVFDKQIGDVGRAQAKGRRFGRPCIEKRQRSTAALDLVYPFESAEALGPKRVDARPVRFCFICFLLCN